MNVRAISWGPEYLEDLKSVDIFTQGYLDRRMGRVFSDIEEEVGQAKFEPAELLVVHVDMKVTNCILPAKLKKKLISAYHT